MALDKETSPAPKSPRARRKPKAEAAPAPPPAPIFEDAATLGEGLTRAREASGLSLAELSTRTRVHRRFLVALEQGDFSSLPSQIFAVGYVRAYAGALGLDEDLAAEWFKRETPHASVPLQAPVGASLEDAKQKISPRMVGVAALLIAAVVGWNIFQRVSRIETAHPSDIIDVPESWVSADPAVLGEAVRLGAPRAAPPDQTIPALYVTRGLEAELVDAAPVDPDAPPTPVVAAPVQAAFNPRGAIYGASATSSQVIIQAKKPASLIVRLPGARILFARQLAAGESWRAPTGVQATIDVSDLTAFDVYLNGEHGGTLSANQTSLASLNSRAAAAAPRVADTPPAPRAPARTGAAPAAATGSGPVPYQPTPSAQPAPSAPTTPAG